MTTAKWMLAASVAVTAMFMSTVSQAATLSVTGGDVLVSHGSGFERVADTVELRKGDSVVARPDGVATLAFADGCSVSLKEQTVFVIGDISPCGTHKAGEGASGATADAVPAAVGGAADLVVPVLVGAAIIGGVVAIATNSGSDNNTPAAGGGGAGGGGGNGGGGGGGGASP